MFRWFNSKTVENDVKHIITLWIEKSILNLTVKILFFFDFKKKYFVGSNIIKVIIKLPVQKMTCKLNIFRYCNIWTTPYPEMLEIDIINKNMGFQKQTWKCQFLNKMINLETYASLACGWFNWLASTTFISGNATNVKISQLSVPSQNLVKKQIFRFFLTVVFPLSVDVIFSFISLHWLQRINMRSMIISHSRMEWYFEATN